MALLGLADDQDAVAVVLTDLDPHRSEVLLTDGLDGGLVVQVEDQDVIPDPVVAVQVRDVVVTTAEHVAEPGGISHLAREAGEAFSTFLVVSRQVAPVPEVLDQGFLHGLQTDTHRVTRVSELVVAVARAGRGIRRPLAGDGQRDAQGLQDVERVDGRTFIVLVVHSSEPGLEQAVLVEDEVAVLVHLSATHHGHATQLALEQVQVVGLALGLAQVLSDVAHATSRHEHHAVVRGLLEDLPEQVAALGEVHFRADVRDIELDVLVGLPTTEVLANGHRDMAQTELIQSATSHTCAHLHRVAVNDHATDLDLTVTPHPSEHDQAAFFVRIVAGLAVEDDDRGIGISNHVCSPSATEVDRMSNSVGKGQAAQSETCLVGWA